jgi:hypothetical protein
MKAYIITAGVIFGLVALSHVARVAQEGVWLLKSPWFVLTSALSVAMCFWAWRVLRPGARK